MGTHRVPAEFPARLKFGPSTIHLRSKRGQRKRKAGGLQDNTYFGEF